MSISQVKIYHDSVRAAYASGNTESSYNPAILALLESFGVKASDKSGERGQAKGGNIDIKLWRADEEPSETNPFAGIEVKKVGGIDARAREQAKTSAGIFGNVILTDNCVWQFYRSGDEERHTEIHLMRQDGEFLTLIEENADLFICLVHDFMLQDPAYIRSSKNLADYMAIHAKTVRLVIMEILKEGKEGQPLDNKTQRNLPMFKDLLGLYAQIKTNIHAQLTTRSFADMYAQTIVYGLLIARYNDMTAQNFDRFKAIVRLQEESRLLDRFFAHIAAGGKLDPVLDSVVEKLCKLYDSCDLHMLLAEGDKGDSIVHFYESFLASYDPAQRRQMGVFYTPRPVVQYLVKMVDKCLIEDFDIQKGLSCNDTMPYDEIVAKESDDKTELGGKHRIEAPKVAVLDPACGTGTFHAEIISFVKEKYFSGDKEIFYEHYIDNCGLLGRLIGFEIMMTSYAVAHLNVRRAVEETLGCPIKVNPQIFLTDTLTEAYNVRERKKENGIYDLRAAIANEGFNASTWKKNRPIMAIVGNPPYLAASKKEYKDVRAYYKEVNGISALKERNPKGLQDDYVKFFRFAQQIIHERGKGILAYVSNNGYLDSPTFRGMRASLLRTFDKIHIVNLHGSSLRKETAPDGSLDENVFDITVGVCLFIGVKTSGSDEPAELRYADLWGRRGSKLNDLVSGNVQFRVLPYDPKMALFLPVEHDLKKEYEAGVSVKDLFPHSSVGIITARSALTIRGERKNIAKVISDFRTYEVPTLRKMYALEKDSRDWKVADAKADAMKDDGVYVSIEWKPFDARWTYYTGRAKGFHESPRDNVMRHMVEAHKQSFLNFALLFSRGTHENWDGAFVTRNVAERHCLDWPSVSAAYLAPLYLHDPDPIDGIDWTPNLNPLIVEELTQNLGSNLYENCKTADCRCTHPSCANFPLKIFDYVYGVLNDPAYIEKYGDFLKRDYPRVPIIENESTFRKYVKAGTRLRRLHVMLDKCTANLSIVPKTGSDLQIGSVKYLDGVLHLNSKKQIHGIPQDVWQYRIGGYQVLDKWLKSHKGETLTEDRMTHIKNIVGLLSETIKIREGLCN